MARRSLDTTSVAPQEVRHPLPPIYDETSRVLILGSFPSPKSREVGFYYGNPQNRFWLVMARVFEEDPPWGASTAELNGARLAFCKRHHLALWDVLQSCTIEGASDSSIKNPCPNNIATILAAAPIEAVFCTGATAAKLYSHLIAPQVGLACTKLPSTSPANAAYTVEKLVAEYLSIRDVVEGNVRGSVQTGREDVQKPARIGKMAI